MSMYKLSERSRNFYTEYYKFLEGGRIIKASLSHEDEEENTWPEIQIKKGNETFEIEVSMDPEGNGPGFLFGLPEPK